MQYLEISTLTPRRTGDSCCRETQSHNTGEDVGSSWNSGKSCTSELQKYRKSHPEKMRLQVNNELRDSAGWCGYACSAISDKLRMSRSLQTVPASDSSVPASISPGDLLTGCDESSLLIVVNVVNGDREG
ncbi:hypothetical protein AB2G40_26390 (plasmid) [Escherichia coli]